MLHFNKKIKYDLTYYRSRILNRTFLLSYSTSVIFIELSDSDKYVAFLEYHGDDEISNFDHILLKLLYVMFMTKPVH
jgi:hypothetical protein